MSSNRPPSSQPPHPPHNPRPRPPAPAAPSDATLLRPVYKQFGEAPPNYVAGLGRGATGFTTRSDIGPAREASMMPPTMDAMQQQQQQQQQPGTFRPAPAPPGGLSGPMQPPFPPPPARREEDEEEALMRMGSGSFDQWSGYNESGLLAAPDTAAAAASISRDEEEEADGVWQDVDKRANRGARRKRARGDAQEEAARTPSAAGADPMAHDIASTFADIKGALSHVSEDEWNAIPEIGDYTIKRKRTDTYIPVPDSLLEKARQENQKLASIDPAAPPPPSPSPQQDRGGPTDLRALGEARENIMKSQLKRLEDSVSGKTTIDPKGYITSLDSRSVLGAAEMGDLKKARTLLKSITRSSPGHAAGWVSRARVEELAGKMSTARNIIMQGLDACTDSEDMWLEAARLHPIEQAKKILAQAVTHVPQSINIWIAAANLEHTNKTKKRVMRKALELIPNSVKLWKDAVELEEPEDARIMLQRAVECIPNNVDLWLALARLEDYDSARKALNRARKHLPTEPLIWIAAAELEEAHGNSSNVDRIIRKGISSLQANQVTIKREDWIGYAYRAEEGGHVATCHAIVRATIAVGVEDVDRKHTWIDDARSAVQPEDLNEQSHLETARAIYAHALSVFPEKKSLWRRAAALEKEYGTRESILNLLNRAVRHCPQSEELWLMAAREKWLAGDVQSAREILLESFKVNRDNEDIWLAAIKIEIASRQFDDARSLLAKAREQAGTERVWTKSAVFERNLGNNQRELELLQEGLQKFPNSAKMWIMRGQWEESMSTRSSNKTDSDIHVNKARETYITGLKHCIHSIALWLCAAKLEERTGQVTRARALLEKARLRNPKIPELWIAAIRLEVRSNNPSNAQSLMAKGLQECPTSGILLQESIELEPRPKRRAKGVQALRINSEHPAVLTAVTKLFWRERKIDTARSWFKRAVAADKIYGDAWAHAYKFELMHGNEEQQRHILESCVEAEPHHGEMWCYLAKQPQNYDLNTEQILKNVADLVDVNVPFTEMTTYVAPSSVDISHKYEEQGK